MTVPYNRHMNMTGAKHARTSLFAVLVAVVMIACFLLAGYGCSGQQGGTSASASTSTSTSTSTVSSSAAQAGGGELAAAEASVSENGSYTNKYEVAAYIHLFGRLPQNYVSKTKARNAGWVPSKGNLQDVLPGKSIGGEKFYNEEGLLPDKNGRTFTECDIDYSGGVRGAKRIVFSNDGLVFYTGDHYKSFEQLY